MGVELLKNIKEAWWREMTLREDVEGIDASILMHPKVWETSGHVENFSDPMVDCKECKARFREDQISDSDCGNKAYKGRKASKCMDDGKFTEARNFNLMFQTHIGPVADESNIVYLRPETAQGIYVNFNTSAKHPDKSYRLVLHKSGKLLEMKLTLKTFCSELVNLNKWKCNFS